MIKTIEAIFDRTALRPDEPLELAPNTRVRLTIEATMAPDKDGLFLRTDSSGAQEESEIVGGKSAEPDPIFRLGREPVWCDVTDGSEQHDRYLYSR